MLRLVLVSLLSAPAPASAPPADELRLVLSAGERLTKTFELHRQDDLQRMHLVVDGEDRSPPMPSMGLVSDSRLVFVDEYREVAGPIPTRLARTFARVDERLVRTFAFEGSASTDEAHGESPLAGRTVVFEWDLESGDFGATAAKGALDAALLDALDPDLDFAFLLAGRAAEPGERWTLAAADFQRLLNPGGELGIRWDEDLTGRADDERMEALLRRSATGEVTAHYVEARDVDGRRVGVVRLAGELKRSAGLEPEPGFGSTGSKERVADGLKLTGELFWDVAAGRLASLRLEGETRVEHTSETRYAAEVHVTELELAGRLTYSVAFAPAR